VPTPISNRARNRHRHRHNTASYTDPFVLLPVPARPSPSHRSLWQSRNSWTLHQSPRPSSFTRPELHWPGPFRLTHAFHLVDHPRSHLLSHLPSPLSVPQLSCFGNHIITQLLGRPPSLPTALHANLIADLISHLLIHLSNSSPSTSCLGGRPPPLRLTHVQKGIPFIAARTSLNLPDVIPRLPPRSPLYHLRFSTIPQASPYVPSPSHHRLIIPRILHSRTPLARFSLPNFANTCI